MSINTIFVNCNIITASIVNDGIQSPILDTLFPDAGPGDKIIVNPWHLIPVTVTLETISEMTCWLADQNNKEIDLRGENLTITLELKKLK